MPASVLGHLERRRQNGLREPTATLVTGEENQGLEHVTQNQRKIKKKQNSFNDKDPQFFFKLKWTKPF